ncbi:glycosyltransferase family 2 protein [Cohaesibacter haloalkalitolerans]|uniref:glycosyltransferase family 2 protein n=1 Tax=Cohaesibacter haloalkalitolerans TaxID=1162980 RepID=UPI000E64E068|nr:glycosyltransferase family 2 protein [Cohaesibacter haloalkalitolerans]
MNPFISIVMSTYNNEKTIAHSLMSVLTFENVDYEIIVVNDGSDDATEKVVVSLSNVDGRIKLISLSRNSGAAFARNVGLANASGDYIMFLDGDDLFFPGVVDDVFANAKSSRPDLLRGGILVKEPKTQWSDFHKNSKLVSFDGSNRSTFVSYSHFTTFAYSRDMINSMDIQFPVDLSIGEDRLFLLKAQMCAETLYLSDKMYYQYNVGLGSAISGAWTEKKADDTIEFLYRMKRTLLDNEDRKSKDLLYTWLPNSFKWQMNLLEKSLKGNNSQRIMKIINSLEDIYFSGISPFDDNYFEKVSKFPAATRKKFNFLFERNHEKLIDSFM